LGALSGGITVKRLLADGPPCADWRKRYIDSLNAYAIRAIGPESEEDRGTGWAAIAHPLDTRFEAEKAFFNEYICVAYRIDTLKVPSSTLKLYQREAELQWLAENHRETMPRPQRKNLYEQVQRDLRARMLPTIKVIDLVWNTDTHQVWVWTQSGKVLEEIDDLFHKTFDHALLATDPYSVGERGLEGAQLEALGLAEPALFLNEATLGHGRGGR
jgi:recombination associated protein RdgC